MSHPDTCRTVGCIVSPGVEQKPRLLYLCGFRCPEHIAHVIKRLHGNILLAEPGLDPRFEAGTWQGSRTKRTHAIRAGTGKHPPAGNLGCTILTGVDRSTVTGDRTHGDIRRVNRVAGPRCAIGPIGHHAPGQPTVEPQITLRPKLRENRCASPSDKRLPFGSTCIFPWLTDRIAVG